MKKHGLGFTLIEVMIAVAIVAILAALAYPSFIQYLIRSNRNVAKGDLMELRQWMERNYSLTNQYDKVPSGAAVALPFTQSPKSGDARYKLAFSVAATSTGFSLSATPVTGSVQAKDTECATLTITSTGLRAVSGTDTVANCWDR
jgi:type IV pilus assembly protein PilE